MSEFGMAVCARKQSRGDQAERYNHDEPQAMSILQEETSVDAHAEA
jgi:hypothetical protein